MEMKSGIYDCLLASRHTTDIDGVEFIDPKFVDERILNLNCVFLSRLDDQLTVFETLTEKVSVFDENVIMEKK